MCLSICLSVSIRFQRSLYFNGQKRHEFDEDDKFSSLNVPHFYFGVALEKKCVPFAHALGTTLIHFTNGKSVDTR